MNPPLPFLPYHLVYANILPHLCIDTRLALGVPPRKLQEPPSSVVDACLRRQQRQTRHSPFSSLTWRALPVRGTDRALVYRVSDGSRACDLASPKTHVKLLFEYT